MSKVLDDPTYQFREIIEVYEKALRLIALRPNCICGGCGNPGEWDRYGDTPDCPGVIAARALRTFGFKPNRGRVHWKGSKLDWSKMTHAEAEKQSIENANMWAANQ